MNCQRTRTAIDEASRRDSMSDVARAHIAGCTDCRRYSEETRALMMLLSAQPRVQAPADFDFRLRARIARAQAQAGDRGLWAVVQRFWTRSFGWGQAAAATAAVALLVVVTSMQLNSVDQPVATSTVKPEAVDVASTSAATTASIETNAPEAAATARLRAAGTSVSNVMTPPVRTARPAVETIAATDPVADNANSNSADTLRIYNPQRDQIIAASNRSMLIGAENSSTGAARTTTYVPSI